MVLRMCWVNRFIAKQSRNYSTFIGREKEYVTKQVYAQWSN